MGKWWSLPIIELFDVLPALCDNLIKAQKSRGIRLKAQALPLGEALAST
jgi:hypothetical protein